MSVICITGSNSPRLQEVENILLQAGMQAPRPLPKEEPIDIRQWQHHVVSSIDGESFGAIKDPGRLWELLAGEIVLANLKSPLWGWCDPASLRFLDFWLGFAPEIKFLLVCQTPQQLLAERLGNSDVPLNLAELLELWKSQQQEMLRFHHRNPERSILVNAADAVAHPELVVAECSKRWNLSLTAVGSVIPSSPESQDALANFVSCRVASLHPEIDALNREILATATIFAPMPFEKMTAEPQLEEILADYLTLRQRLANEERKSLNEAERLQSENSRLQQKEIEQQNEIELQKEVGQQKEVELLLLLSQMNLVQSELETVLLKEKESKEQIETLKKEKSVAEKERATLTVTNGDLQQKLSAARQARDELARKLSERQAQIDQLIKDREQQKKETDELQKQKETLLLREREEQASRLQAKMKEQQQENELLLQLRQTQGKLEAVSLQEQEARQQIEVLKKDISIAEAERATLATRYDGLQQDLSAARLARDEHARALSERQTQIDQLTSDRVGQEKLTSELKKQADDLVSVRERQVLEMKERQQENELLLLQLQQVQEELETVFLREQKATQQIEVLKKEKSVAGAERDEHVRLLSERQAQIDQLSKDRDRQKKEVDELTKQGEILSRESGEQISRLQAEVKEQQQENELLLLQLQQVQEELERYFLQHQQIQQLSSFAKISFHRLLEREPKFYDYEELEVSPGSRGDATPSINCRLSNLIAAGRHFPALAFTVAIDNGVAGLLFPAATQTALLRPLAPVAGESELVISPVGSAEKLPQRLNHLATLSTSDWSLVTTLIRLLNDAFAQPQRLQWNSPLSSSLFLSGLQQLQLQIEPYEVRLRYDEIKLKREQVNPDYEHLWFEFVNLSFQGEIWPHFEFRLSCAHVRPDYFGGFPKLEFPAEGSQAPFEGWFIEANDDFGDKLELRFSLPDKALDLGVWERVTEHDRTFMKALAAELPKFLTTLRQSGVQIARSWEDWSGMVAEMQSVMAQCDAAFSAIVVAPAEKVTSPTGLHYEVVKLKREQVNPDYEHLWFEFANLSFSGENWPHFEFRLSCAHVRPDNFGGFPKLEFPAEGSQAPFKGWFIEACDDFGEKLELRFSVPDKALDLGVWERVTEHDRAFMKALVAELPDLFSTLRQSGVKIRRPWEDWTKMVEEMLPIVSNPPKLKGKKKFSFEKLLRRLNLSEK